MVVVPQSSTSMTINRLMLMDSDHVNALSTWNWLIGGLILLAVTPSVLTLDAATLAFSK